MEWYGTLPQHWETRKIKYTFSERVEKGFPDEPLLVASQNMGVVPKAVYGSRTVEAMKDLHNLKLVCVGDFVISLRSFQGGLEYAYYKGIISPAYTVMIPNECIASGYFRYLAKSSPFIELLKLCVTGIREGQNVDYSKLKNHQIPLPPRSEQDAIVRYLDWKVSGVNRLIAAKRRQVELLAEMKRAVVNEAVTRGGDGWSNDKLSRLFHTIGSGTTPKSGEGDYFNGNIHWVNSGDLKPRLLFDTSKKVSEQAVQESSALKMFKPQTIVIAMYGASIGNMSVAQIDFCCNQACCCLGDVNERLLLDFAYYTLLSCKTKWIEDSNGGGQPNISQDIIKQTWIAFPPLEEQKKIVAHLDKVCYNIDSATEKLTVEVALLGEYRTRLIADVVTGKIDVRGMILFRNAERLLFGGLQ